MISLICQINHFHFLSIFWYKLTRFARSFVYFCEKNYLIPSLLRVRELKTICFFPSVSNDTFITSFNLNSFCHLLPKQHQPAYKNDHIFPFFVFFTQYGFSKFFSNKSPLCSSTCSDRICTFQRIIAIYIS